MYILFRIFCMKDLFFSLSFICVFNDFFMPVCTHIYFILWVLFNPLHFLFPKLLLLYPSGSLSDLFLWHLACLHSFVFLSTLAHVPVDVTEGSQQPTPCFYLKHQPQAPGKPLSLPLLCWSLCSALENTPSAYPPTPRFDLISWMLSGFP